MAPAFPALERRTGGPDDVCYAGFWRRMAADIVDNALLLPVVSLLAPSQLPTRWSTGGLLAALTQSAAADPIRQVLALILGIAYSIFFWIRYLGTPGKLLFHCHLVDAKTLGPLTIKQSLLRNLGYFVSWGTLGLGFLWIAWDKRKQGFHDKIAGSVVLHVLHPAAHPHP